MNNLFLTYEFEQKMKNLESKLANRYKHVDNLLKNNPDSPEGYKQSLINLKTSYEIEFEGRKKKLIAEYNEKLNNNNFANDDSNKSNNNSENNSSSHNESNSNNYDTCNFNSNNDKKMEENIPLEKQVESVSNLFLTHEFEQKMKNLESKLADRKSTRLISSH